jgi:hypothetical protein
LGHPGAQALSHLHASLVITVTCPSLIPCQGLLKILS